MAQDNTPACHKELFKAFDNRAVQGSSVFVSHEDAGAKDVTPISDIVGGSWAGIAIINHVLGSWDRRRIAGC